MKVSLITGKKITGVIYGQTSAISGTFETSSQLDTRAAQMRNSTIPLGGLVSSQDGDSAGTPIVAPEVMDRPE